MSTIYLVSNFLLPFLCVFFWGGGGGVGLGSAGEGNGLFVKTESTD